VIVDDITRPTPKKRILTEVLRRLAAGGVPRSQVRVVMGLGTHRQMRMDEIEAYLGKENLAGVELVNNDYKDKTCFVDLGVTENGTPIEVYRAVMEADFKIAIGNIVPHVAAGWGGGAKMIQPAVCSERTTGVTHLMAATKQNVFEVCGNADNLVRREMETIAGRVGLNFIVNTVLNDEKQMLGVFSGHFVQAHRAGVELAKQVLCPRIPAQADIVIASANPAHVDMWQGCKPYIFSLFGLKPGGVLIFVIDATEGLCGNAPQHEAALRDYSLVPFEELKALVDQGKIVDKVGAHVPLFFATVRQKAFTTLCVSHGLTPQDKACLGFEHAETVEAALQKAYQLTSPHATVGIMPYAGETLVRL
jgi:nickel-dependent lactate racemase